MKRVRLPFLRLYIALAFGLGASVLVTPHVARAQPSPRTPTAPTTRAIKAAQVHFEKGRAKHEAGSYDEAIAEFLAAYALVPRPALLFNIARSYEKKGELDQALSYYQKVMLVQKDGELAVWSRQATEKILQQQAADGAKPRPATPPPTSEAAEPMSTAENTQAAGNSLLQESTAQTTSPTEAQPNSTAASAALAAPVPSAPTDDSNPGRGLRIAGLSSAIVGAVAIGLGVKFGLDAGSASDRLGGSAPISTAEYPRIVEEGESAERNMFISYAVGGALLAGGGILYYFGKRAERPSSVAVAPVLGPSTATVHLRGTF